MMNIKIVNLSKVKQMANLETEGFYLQIHPAVAKEQKLLMHYQLREKTSL